MNPNKTKPTNEFALWNFFVVVWICLKKLIIPRFPTSWEERCRLSLWVPNMAHQSPLGEVSCHQVQQKILQEVGINVLGDVMDIGNFMHGVNVVCWTFMT